MRFIIGSLLALMIVAGCAESPPPQTASDSRSPAVEAVNPAPTAEDAALTVDEEPAEPERNEQHKESPELAQSEQDAKVSQPDASSEQPDPKVMAKGKTSEDSSQTVAKTDDQPVETTTEKPSEKQKPDADDGKTAKSDLEDQKSSKSTDIASIDMSTLTAEQRFAVLRAQAMGQPIPTFGKGPPKEIKLLVPEKDFVRDPQHDALRVTFDDIDLLKTLNMEPVPLDALEYFPEWLKNLDGKRIILRGWMFPAGRDDGISTFMFVRDSGLCCFGSNPKIYDKLAVTMREGVTTKYIEGRPFDVVATLRIDPEILDDEWWWLFHLDDALVIDK